MMWKLLRVFDLEYWQMREALGYPIPAWVDRRWPRQFQGQQQVACRGVHSVRCERCAFWHKNPTIEDAKGACSYHMRSASRLGSCRDFVAGDKNFLRIVLDTLVADGDLVKVWHDGKWCYGKPENGQ